MNWKNAIAMACVGTMSVTSVMAAGDVKSSSDKKAGPDYKVSPKPYDRPLVLQRDRPILKPAIDRLNDTAVAQLLRDLALVAKGGYVTREDILNVMNLVKSAHSDKVVTEDEKAAVKAAIDAIKGKIPADLMAKIQLDIAAIKANVDQQVEQFWKNLAEKTSQEFVDAAQAVLADLKKIHDGKFVDKEAVDAFMDQLKKIASDGKVTQEELDGLRSSVQDWVKANVPADLLNQLNTDLETLKTEYDKLPHNLQPPRPLLKKGNKKD